MNLRIGSVAKVFEEYVPVSRTRFLWPKIWKIIVEKFDIDVVLLSLKDFQALGEANWNLQLFKTCFSYFFLFLGRYLAFLFWGRGPQLVLTWRDQNWEPSISFEEVLVSGSGILEDNRIAIFPRKYTVSWHCVLCWVMDEVYLSTDSCFWEPASSLRPRGPPMWSKVQPRSVFHWFSELEFLNNLWGLRTD